MVVSMASAVMEVIRITAGTKGDTAPAAIQGIMRPEAPKNNG